MKNVRYELLKINNKKKTVKHKKRILKNIEKFLEGEKFGVFMLSEIDSKGNDSVKTLAINCDVIHSKEIIKYLIENLPGVKDELVEESRQEFGQMVS